MVELWGFKRMQIFSPQHINTLLKHQKRYIWVSTVLQQLKLTASKYLSVLVVSKRSFGYLSVQEKKSQLTFGEDRKFLRHKNSKIKIIKILWEATRPFAVWEILDVIQLLSTRAILLYICFFFVISGAYILVKHFLAMSVCWMTVISLSEK